MHAHACENTGSNQRTYDVQDVSFAALIFTQPYEPRRVARRLVSISFNVFACDTTYVRPLTNAAVIQPYEYIPVGVAVARCVLQNWFIPALGRFCRLFL